MTVEAENFWLMARMQVLRTFPFPFRPQGSELLTSFRSVCLHMHLYRLSRMLYFSTFYIFVFRPQGRGKPELLSSFRQRQRSEVQLHL